jgi:hypothetical protein
MGESNQSEKKDASFVMEKRDITEPADHRGDPRRGQGKP